MAEYQIGIENWKPIRKKPVLTLINNTEHIKVASFNNQESADLFYNVFCTNYVKSTDKAIRTIRDLQSKEDEVCEWKLFDEEANAYNTTCGGAFWFNDGSPKDNGFKYCPYCGKKIKIVGGVYDKWIYD